MFQNPADTTSHSPNPAASAAECVLFGVKWGAIAGAAYGLFFLIIGLIPGAMLGAFGGLIAGILGARLRSRIGWAISGAIGGLTAGIMLWLPGLITTYPTFASPEQREMMIVICCILPAVIGFLVPLADGISKDLPTLNKAPGESQRQTLIKGTPE